MTPTDSIALPWLLEPDSANPAVRYYALRDLAGRDEDAHDVLEARRAIMASGPVPAILEAQHPDGYWVKPGAGYSPKYQGTVWQILFLADLGADPADERGRRGCGYLLAHSQAASGVFSASQPPVPSSGVHCLNGNLLFALIKFGYQDDATKVQAAIDWQAQAITGDGEIRFYKSGTAGPGFACGVNLGQPCGWGAAKALKGLSAIPAELRSPLVQRAIEAGVEFLLSRDLAEADYPYTERVSSTWFKFGFPLSYWSNVLESAALLADLGFGQAPRLRHAIELISSKQDDQGQWRLENSLNGKMWVDIERKGEPSKWVTLQALRFLSKCGVPTR